MHYRLSAARPLQEAVPAIAADQLGAAIARLNSANQDHTAVHEARKHLKRTRALLGLVECAARGNTAKSGRKRLASAARMLAAARDAQVVIGAAQALEREFEPDGRTGAFSDLTSFLKARRDRTAETLGDDGLDKVAGELKGVQASLDELDLSGIKMSDLLEPASEVYGRGRLAMKTALKSGGDEALHSWRKLVQLHWRHMMLLKQASPLETGARIGLAKRLSDNLGQHHDLAVLRDTVLANRIVFRSPSDVKMLCHCIEAKQSRLVKRAAARGVRLYAEKPRAFAMRLRLHWNQGKRRSSPRERRPHGTRGFGK